jgi:hypothetical protein
MLNIPFLSNEVVGLDQNFLFDGKGPLLGTNPKLYETYRECLGERMAQVLHIFRHIFWRTLISFHVFIRIMVQFFIIKC